MMVNPLTEIHYLDKNDNSQSYTFINVMLRRYWSRADIQGDDTYIRFNGDVMIRDNYGWTDLIYVKCHSFKELPEWMSVASTMMHRDVFVTPDELIPVYYPHITKEGYHGRVLYAYHLRPAKHLFPIMYVRCVSSYSPEQQFKVVQPRKRKDPIPSDTEKQKPIYHGYEIVTKSGLYAANGIILNGSGQVDSGVSKLTEYGWN